jgi:hypothetical protein
LPLFSKTTLRSPAKAAVVATLKTAAMQAIILLCMNSSFRSMDEI